MPPLFDEAQIHNALRNEALPELARLAGDERLRERAVDRFDRDEPPPYVSSTDDDEYFEDEPPLGFDGSSVLDEFTDALKPALDDVERDAVAAKLWYYMKVYDPGQRYRQEALLEEKRVRNFCRRLRPDNAEAEKLLDFQGRAGDERVNLIVRRNIKRRWRKLGVWNPQWGIPDRRNNTKPDDDASKWKWRWQHGNASAEWTPSATATTANPGHPITRALALRRGLHRGEHAPVLPRARLQDDAPASQAESFIISRPWVVYATDYAEEIQRSYRIPTQRRRHYTESMAKPVIERWKSRGDWRDEWGDPDGTVVPGWKWRHESPSPEPEDLAPLETMDLEFTPSEVDALEAIQPPTPPPSPPSPRYFPPGDPRRPHGTGLFATPPPPDLPPTAPAAGSDRPQSPGPTQPASPPGPRSRRQKNKEPTQPLRRSARIAAINRANPPPPLAPPRKTRGTSQIPGRKPPASRAGTDRTTRTDRRAVSKKPSAQLGQAETAASERPRGRPRKKGTRR